MSTKKRNVHSAVHWVGIDVSKATFDACLLSVDDQEQGAPLRDLPTLAFRRTRDGVCKFLAWRNHQVAEAQSDVPTRVVMEATGKYSHELAMWLVEEEPALDPAIVNPQPVAHFIESLPLRNITDDLCARALALYGAQRRPAGYEPPSPEEAQVRELSRYRQSLVETKTAMRNQAGEGAQSKFVEKMQAKRLGLLDKDIVRVEAEMRAIVQRIDGFRQDVELLQTIHGVGFLTAVIVRAELGDLRRFERARQLAAFAGLSPRESRSGTSVHRRTRMSKAGNARVRAVLYMAVCAGISRPHPMQAAHHRFQANGKRPMESIGALMRKLLVLMRAILISGQSYDPNFKTCGKPILEMQKNTG
jgi:transposase